MPNALLTGVSGLLAHQRMLDTTANNIANLNTPGYKSQRVVFDDLLYETIRPASSANDGDIGGTNPSQIGSGVKAGQIDRKFTQGNIEVTGEQFDFAIDGNGFFVVSDGTKQLYARAGAFSLDEKGVLVDGSTGYKVMRVGDLGEPDGIDPGFQVPGESAIRIPIGASIAGQETRRVQLEGNLNADLSVEQRELLTSNSPFRAGGAPATAATLLNALDTNNIDYVANDRILLQLSDVNGQSQTITMNVDGTTTLGDVVDEINAALTDATASIDGAGNIVVEANNVGPASLSLSIRDDGAAKTNFAVHVGLIAREGKLADTVERTLSIFDTQGNERTVTVTFVKRGEDMWDAEVSMKPIDGVVIDNSIQQIRFDDKGLFQSVADPTISFQFTGVAAPQTVTLSFLDGSDVGMTHFGSESTLRVTQDGFPPGSLSSVKVGIDGTIQGIASNGRLIPIAQLALASFTNPRGLTAVGDNLFEQTLNSGVPEIGTGLANGRGSVLGARLETSNVDLAFEFTRMVVAQRGFSANARTITVADEMLEELTNVIR